jgi:hypothetical protein
MRVSFNHAILIWTLSSRSQRLAVHLAFQQHTSATRQMETLVNIENSVGKFSEYSTGKGVTFASQHINAGKFTGLSGDSCR